MISYWILLIGSSRDKNVNNLLLKQLLVFDKWLAMRFPIQPRACFLSVRSVGGIVGWNTQKLVDGLQHKIGEGWGSNQGPKTLNFDVDPEKNAKVCRVPNLIVV